jgi:FkbM family methyltransferase
MSASEPTFPPSGPFLPDFAAPNFAGPAAPATIPPAIQAPIELPAQLRVQPATQRPQPRRPGPAPAVPQALARKAELEAAMAADPDDTGLRAAYFEHLTALSVSNTGLLWAHLPEVGAPLAFRAGTPDIAVLAQVFRDHALAFEMHATPLRILLIGAYAGYSAVELARRYPRAIVLAAEPLRDNFRLLSLNTGGWRRIRVAQTAVWHSATRVAAAGRFQADWAVRLSEEALDADRVIPTMSVRELLARAGWNHADLIVCDASGAEREIFADRLQPWLAGCDALLIRFHEQSGPGGAAAVEAAFPKELFDRRKIGQMDLFTRRVPRTAQPRLPAELRLLHSDPGLMPFRLSEVPPAPWGFFVFDGSSCQLHPNVTPGRPCRVMFAVTERGYVRFISGIVHAGLGGANAVVFTALILRETGEVAAQSETRLGAQESGRLTLPLPELDGPFHVVLQTELAPGSGHNQMAWARWLDPRLV